MVYCGKPSKGCSHCRERKVRCDQREPGCGQCEKRGQTCPGYRNLVDLMFRDESSHVISKASKSRSRNPSRARSRTPRGGKLAGRGTTTTTTPSVSLSSSPAPRPAPSPGLLRPPPTTVFASIPGSRRSSYSEESTKSMEDLQRKGEASPPPYVLSADLQERGTAFFFSRYVTPDNGCHQNYGFIYDIWKPPNPGAEQVVDCVTASMTAVGLAGLSQLTDSRDTMHEARQSYGLALKLTNTALKDPTQATKDTTMLAVLILGSYEAISGRCPQTMQAWKEHVKGAAALASLRGSVQFQSKSGIRMFLMLSHSVLTSCIQSGLPIPQTMVDLHRELDRSGEHESPAWRIVDPIHRALQVRYDIKIGKLQDVDAIVEKLSDIDDEFDLLLSELPSSWGYRRVQLTREDPRVLGRSCHVYSGLAQVTTWNEVRAIRILTLETIVEQLCAGLTLSDPSSLPHRQQLLLAETIKLLEKLGAAIVASIPQHFGVVSYRDVHGPATKASTVSISAQHQPIRPSSSRAISESPAEDQSSTSSTVGTPTFLDPAPSGDQGSDAERFMTLTSASNTIIWPLYVLGMSSSCFPWTREYLIGRLHAIHKETGLEQARVVAGILQTKGQPPIPINALSNRLPPLPKDALPAIV